MKVDDPKLSGMQPSHVGGSQATDTASVRSKKTETGGAASRDEVALSDLSAKIRELDSDSPERAARLARIAAEVEAGRYRVDPMQVSDRIIDDALSSSDMQRREE